MIGKIKSMFQSVTAPSEQIQALTKLMDGSKLDGCTPWSYLRSFTIYFKDRRGYLKFDYNAISKRYEGFLTFRLDGKCIAMLSEYDWGFSDYVKVALSAHPEISQIVTEFQLKFEEKMAKDEQAKKDSLKQVLGK